MQFYKGGLVLSSTIGLKSGLGILVLFFWSLGSVRNHLRSNSQTFKVLPLLLLVLRLSPQAKSFAFGLSSDLLHL